MQKILLITGWGGGAQLLQPLQYHLIQQGYQVELWNIFNALDPQIVHEKVIEAQKYDVIIGWSLGGQLATILVDHIEQKFQQQKILITLASNPCFVAQVNWQFGMNVEIFAQFKQSFQEDASNTLKKFGYMVCQGTAQTKQDFIQLQKYIQPQNLWLLTQGLECLQQLNLVKVLANYSGRQYHLFAKQDFLVSYKVMHNLALLNQPNMVVEMMSGSHAMVLVAADVVSEKISNYLVRLN